MMSDKSKNCKTKRVENKENSAEQDQSTEVGRRRKYYTRAAKKLDEEISETKQSCIREEEAAKKHREGILKSKHSSEKQAKIYKETFPQFNT